MPAIVVLRRTQASVQRAQAELALHSDFQWAGGTQEWRQIDDLIRRAHPELLVCDLRLVDGNAMHVLKELRRTKHWPKVLLLTPSADDLLLFHALRAGAHAYALDRGEPSVLGQALLDLLTDQATMSPMLARQVLASFGADRLPLRLAMEPPQVPLPGAANPLLDADRRLLSLLAHGLLADEVARAWGLALEQIGRQIAQLYRKLHAAQTRSMALSAAP